MQVSSAVFFSTFFCFQVIGEETTTQGTLLENGINVGFVTELRETRDGVHVYDVLHRFLDTDASGHEVRTLTWSAAQFRLEVDSKSSLAEYGSDAFVGDAPSFE